MTTARSPSLSERTTSAPGGREALLPGEAEARLIKSCPPLKSFDSKGLHRVFQMYAESLEVPYKDVPTCQANFNVSSFGLGFQTRGGRVRFKWKDFMKAVLTNRR